MNRYNLSKNIRLDTEVKSVARENKKWKIRTSNKSFTSDHLVLASAGFEEATLSLEKNALLTITTSTFILFHLLNNHADLRR